MGTKPFDVVVVGELNPDLILSGNVRPEFGQVEKMVEKGILTIGSSSVIFACGAARLGLRVAFIGKVGRDLFGAFMRQALAEYGIDTGGVVQAADVATGISVILSEGEDRAILTFPGTIPLLEYSDIDLDIARQARHLHVGSYYIQYALQSGLPDLFDKAHQWGLTTSLDTNYDPKGVWDDGVEQLLKKVDLFLPNAAECKGIARTSNLDQAINELQKRVKYLGVKLGKDGAILYHEAVKYYSKPIPVAVVDTVGAGDSFDAGFIYGYLAGWEPERIIKMANICGSLSTRQAGGTAAQPTFDEAKNYL